MSNEKRLSQLTLLKKGELKYPMNPDEAELQTFDNLNKERNFWITFKTPEFTSLMSSDGSARFCPYHD